jgi:hypothetical protein
MKTEKSWWQRLCERLVKSDQPAAGELPEREAMDVELNDRTLVNLREDDPVWRALMDYAYVHVENNLNAAFDAGRSREDRFDFMNRAAGVAAMISDVESTRARLKEEEEKRKKEKGIDVKG